MTTGVRRRNRGRRSHDAFAGGAAGGVGDVTPLVGRNVIAAGPRRGPRSKRIIADVRFEIANREMSHIVRRLVGRVREARA